MVLRPSGKESRCPSCGQPARRLHSRYCRRLSDLPWEGIPVSIELRVRRFFCSNEDCGQHIFTERLPKTVERYARRTCRLSASLEQITLALGGAAGSRLAQQLGILANGSTLLRQLRRKGITFSADAPRVLGIDDWAWRKGRRYGTIRCDLERGKVVDLLPDRSTEAPRNGSVRIPAQKSSAATEPVSMPKRRQKPRRTPYKWRIGGIFFTT
jgi:transposase